MKDDCRYPLMYQQSLIPEERKASNNKPTHKEEAIKRAPAAKRPRKDAVLCE